MGRQRQAQPLAVHAGRARLARRCGRRVRSREGRLRVATPDVGGGFGAKTGVYPEEVMVAWVARKLQCGARWHETRSENMVGMGHGRGQVQTVEIGGSRDGDVEAYRLTVLQDGGAYGSIGSILPFLTRTMAPGVYAIPKVECNTNSVVTNTTPLAAYRGAAARSRGSDRAGHGPVRRGDRHRRRRRATAQPRAEVRRAVRHDGGNVVRQRRLRDRARSRARFGRLRRAARRADAPS